MIDFGNMPVRTNRWTFFKQIATKKEFVLQFEEDNFIYQIYGYDGPEVYNCIIWKSAVPEDVINGGYTQEQNDIDKTDFQTNYQSSTNKRIGIIADSENRMRVSPEPRKEGDQVIIVSHNWCDKCTWYGQSIRVTGEALTDGGDGYSFNSAHTYWIDLSHGRIYREDIISSAYLPKIYINGTQKTERTPFATSGGDFVINYETGVITFSTYQLGNTITADYSYQNGSRFIVAPTSGKKLWLEKTEVQFSKDVDIKDTVHFQAWAYNPYNPPQKVAAGSKTTYKVARDYVDEANGAYPEIPMFGGSSGRGLSSGHLVFPFNYLQIKELKSSYGVEIRVWLENNTAFGGTFGTVTFYCTSHDE